MGSCHVFRAADVVGKKWSIPVLQEVALNGDKGFNEMFLRLGKISPKVLSQRLKQLEKEGIVEKDIFTNSMPVRTSYKLTQKGRALSKVLDSLKPWSLAYSKEKANCGGIACVDCPLY